MWTSRVTWQRASRWSDPAASGELFPTNKVENWELKSKTQLVSESARLAGRYFLGGQRIAVAKRATATRPRPPLRIGILITGIR